MNLFEPGNIGKLHLKNRIIMAPMGIGALVEPDGRLSRRALDYYEARAKGGVGMITTCFTCVDDRVEKKTENGLGVIARIDQAIHINSFSELADIVHDYGAKLCVQLTAGMGRVAFGDILRKGHSIAPSNVKAFWNPKITARELTISEIKELIAAFERAAIFLSLTGVDAIELHGHEGYLLDQFQTSLWNQRQDEYGGNFENRMRFLREILSVLRKRLGKNFPIIYRYGIRQHIEGERSVGESLKIAEYLEDIGVDALHVDAGCYESWYWAHPPIYQPKGCMVDMAELAKTVVKIPVISVGKLDDPNIAEGVLQEDKADFICLGRALLADPEWPNKVDKKRNEDIRPCIGDHVGCLSRVFEGKYLSCAVNPTVGKETEFHLKPAEVKKKVLVVGGGPAGMEAARVAAMRGHEVVLWEKSDQLGGNLIPASFPHFKKDLRDLVSYLSRQVNKLGVQVNLGVEADFKSIQSAAPDVVIVATGATALIPPIPGNESSNVCTAIDLFSGHEFEGNKVLIIGGGIVGCETALYLAQKEYRVTVLELFSKVMRGENNANKQNLIKLLDDVNVEILTGCQVTEVNQKNAKIRHENGDTIIEADKIVLAVGLQSRVKLRDELLGYSHKTIDAEIYAIGDCVKPRRVLDAIWGGFRIARMV